MADTSKNVIVFNPTEEDVDLDVLVLSPMFTVMRGRTWAIASGRSSHYFKVTVVEQILPDETEQEFRERMTLLLNREASAEFDAANAWLEENGL